MISSFSNWLSLSTGVAAGVTGGLYIRSCFLDEPSTTWYTYMIYSAASLYLAQGLMLMVNEKLF